MSSLKTQKQIELWKKLATIAAFTALGLLLFGYWIGTETIVKCVAVLITSLLFACSVVWWYWALNQIGLFAKYISSLKDVIRELKDDLKNIRKDLK